MDFFITPAWAQAAGAPSSSPLMTMLPLLLIFVVFYFLLIRPQTKRAKEHREMVGKARGRRRDRDHRRHPRPHRRGRRAASSRSQIASGVAIRVQKFQVAQLMPKGTFKSA